MKDNKKLIKYTSGITALALALTLNTGCSNTSRFKLTQNEKGEYTAVENSYIDNNIIGRYYVIETYSNINNKSKIYIAYYGNDYYDRDIGNYYSYINIFNNFFICYGNNGVNENITFIKETPLIDYLNSYDLIKARYTYEDMQKIYETILENYTFEDISNYETTSNILTRKKVLDKTYL